MENKVDQRFRSTWLLQNSIIWKSEFYHSTKNLGLKQKNTNSPFLYEINLYIATFISVDTFQVEEIKLLKLSVALIYFLSIGLKEQIKSCATHLSGSRQRQARFSSSNNGTKDGT